MNSDRRAWLITEKSSITHLQWVLYYIFIYVCGPNGINGHHAAFQCGKCCGFKYYLGQDFVWSSNCYSECSLCPFVKSSAPQDIFLMWALSLKNIAYLSLFQYLVIWKKMLHHLIRRVLSGAVFFYAYLKESKQLMFTKTRHQFSIPKTEKSKISGFN